MMTGADRWARLQDRYRTAYARMTALRAAEAANPTRTACSAAAAASARLDRANDACFAWLDEFSPRDWHRGVPAHWVCSELGYFDAVTEGPLSVEPPLGYGATRTSQAADLAVVRPSAGLLALEADR